MLDRSRKAALRAMIFRHLDGLATGPVLDVLHRRQVLDKLLQQKTVNLESFAKELHANEGYLNVALRILCSQGWLQQDINHKTDAITYSLTAASEAAFKLAPFYQLPVAFIKDAVHLQNYIVKGFDVGAFNRLSALFDLHRKGWELPDDLPEELEAQVRGHLEGLIAGPLIVSLGIRGLFHNYFSVAPFRVEEYSLYDTELRAILRFFTELNWMLEKDGIFNFTEEGVFLARRAAAYGVTVSYLPMFGKVEELIFGDPGIFWNRPAGSPEIHVDRAMNVWGSGGAHSTYFKKIDEIIIDIFNRPLAEQPAGFLDMGCGNGALIEHVFDVIWKQTARGKVLSDHPLFIIGADYNQAALQATRKTLLKADIWAKVVWGDISDPDQLASELKEKYNIQLGDLLNMRSFLDHNRIFQFPAKVTDQFEKRSSGAFAFRGKRIPNELVQQNLVDHLRKWAPYVRKFGLLLLELHTIDPQFAAGSIGQTAVTAYDATHGFSDQYILELPVFLEAAAIAGLEPAKDLQAAYPSAEAPIVSIQLLVGE
ncbi:MAG: class I SAM-dependent methyltransferase [Bacteroidetes bacterium]|nr:class I SAM-dependent methyltransferase [Bacteroidota bacterium]